MQAAMPTSPTRAEGKTAHIPRLSYRSSVQVESLQSLNVPNRPVAEEAPKSPFVEEIPKSSGSETNTKASSITSRPRPGDSGTTLRSTTSRGNDRSSNHSKNVVSPVTQKKKSLFGGLFVGKEPTAVALERLAAQLEAQHGELSPRAIPGVSSSKLPEHVPKVNTKWDGVPEAVKERERLLKEKARTAKRQSVAPSTRSRSAEGSQQANEKRAHRRPIQKTTSTSTLSSFDSRGQAERRRDSHLSDDVQAAYSKLNSDPGRGRTSNKPPSTKSQSLRSPSGSSLPPITAFFPNDIPSQPALPGRFKSPSSHTVGSNNTTSTGRTRFEQAEPIFDVVPEHTSSPSRTPLDRSPVTPSATIQNQPSTEPSILPIWGRTEEGIYITSGSDFLGPKVTGMLRQKGKAQRDAFLAGEARPFELPDEEAGPGPAVIESELDLPIRGSPKRNSNAGAPQLPAHARVQQDLEKRPDSSRARLGLRASMLIRADQAPWDLQELDKTSDNERSASPRLSMPVVPKSISKVLGKANK